MQLQVHIGSLEVAAPRAVRFGPFDAANLIRGHLGKELFRAQPELYQRLYNPEPLSGGPSGFADPPRPIRLITRHLAGRSFRAGEPIGFQVHLFDASLLPALGTSNFRLLQLDLNAPFAETSQLEIQFLTPTEIRGVPQPDFGPLLARLRDRLSLLRTFYGAGPLEIDFRGLGERATMVQLLSTRLESMHASRRSTSQQTRHPLGGFFGTARYAGDLTEFLPYLYAGQFTGLGKYTVWGQGEISIPILPAATSSLK